MPIIPRIVVCDVCGSSYQEPDVSVGFSGWSIVNGIGARAPKTGAPMMVENTQTCLCPHCTAEVSQFIDTLQRRMQIARGRAL